MKLIDSISCHGMRFWWLVTDLLIVWTTVHYQLFRLFLVSLSSEYLNTRPFTRNGWILLSDKWIFHLLPLTVLSSCIALFWLLRKLKPDRIYKVSLNGNHKEYNFWLVVTCYIKLWNLHVSSILYTFVYKKSYKMAFNFRMSHNIVILLFKCHVLCNSEL